MDSLALWPRVSEAFDRASALGEVEREAFLLGLDSSDPEVAREVRALLAADRETSALMEAAGDAVRDMVAGDGETELEGVVVGKYRLVRCLGKGGMGEVWEAERADGRFAQSVAVKLLKRGLDSNEIFGRFLRERQILALLEHPGITRLLDGGVAPDGRPYLVMERVVGRPITELVTERKMPLKERLRLFLRVCDAVEAAHRALVVHRDLKPSNILVTEGGDPKLLDFGVAKVLSARGGLRAGDGAGGAGEDRAATGGRPYEGPAVGHADGAEGGKRGEDRLDKDPTRGTHFLGAPLTPAYAAPEQILGGAITTATDVYSLGVVLYELLVGRRPFRRGARAGAALVSEVEHETATRPSEALKERLSGSVARGAIDRDLDAVLLKAIRGAPRERYPTVAALAGDLSRYLAGLPVEARGGRSLYRARKFLTRNRWGVALGTALLAALVLGAALALWQAARAEREAERAREVERFLVDVFAKADPSRTQGERLSARQILDEGSRRVERDLVAQPAVRASLEETLSRSYRGLGLLKEAKEHAERAVGLREAHDGRGSLPAASARLTLAEALLDAGDPKGGREALAPALARLERSDAPPLELARALASASVLTQLEGDLTRALETGQRALAIVQRVRGADHPDAVAAQQTLASLFGGTGQLAKAISTFEDALMRTQRNGRGESPEAALIHTNLADVLEIVGEIGKAEEHFQKALVLWRRAYGDDHPEVAQALLKYGFFLVQRRRYTEAEESLLPAQATLSRLYHFDVANAWRYLGFCAMGRERYSEAERRFEAAEARLRKELGEDHQLRWTAVVSLAQARSKLGRLAQAEAMQRDAIAALTRLYGPESSEVRIPIKNLGETLRKAGRIQEAIALHRQALAVERKIFSTDSHLGIVNTKRLLALDLIESPDKRHRAEARRLLDECLESLRSSKGEENRLAEVLETSAQLAGLSGDRDRERRELQQAVDLWEKDPEPDPLAAGEARKRLRALRNR